MIVNFLPVFICPLAPVQVALDGSVLIVLELLEWRRGHIRVHLVWIVWCVEPASWIFHVGSTSPRWMLFKNDRALFVLVQVLLVNEDRRLAHGIWVNVRAVLVGRLANCGGDSRLEIVVIVNHARREGPVEIRLRVVGFWSWCSVGVLEIFVD